MAGKAYDLTYISLGGGRQSSAMAVCSVLGLHGIPQAQYAIFADTMREAPATYSYLDNLSEWLGKRGLPVLRVSKGDLLKDILEGFRSNSTDRQYVINIPVFTLTKDGTGSRPLTRQCTERYKIRPIRRKVKELLGLPPDKPARGKRSLALIGISLDEVHRMKDSPLKWEDRAYPLINARLRVEDCVRILVKQGLGIPPKSACYFCPYHDDYTWIDMKRSDSETFELACQVDDQVRDKGYLFHVEGQLFLHRSLQPLREINFEARIHNPNQLTLAGFGNECEGMCGV